MSEFEEFFRHFNAASLNIRLDIHHHFPDDLETQNLLSAISAKVDRMSQKTDELAAAMAAEDTVIASAVTAIKGFPDVLAAAVEKALKDANVDQAAIDAAVAAATADAQAQTAALQAALTQNTPEAGATPAPSA